MDVSYGLLGPLQEDINIDVFTCILEASKWAVAANHIEVILISDSKLAPDCIVGGCAIPWKYLCLVWVFNFFQGNFILSL